MKTITKWGALILLISFVLSSCNSGLSITKRRYSKGYYVHHTGKPGEPVNRENSRTHENRDKNKSTAAAQPTKPANPQGEIIVKDKEVLTAGVTKPAKEDSWLFTGKSSTVDMIINHPIKTFKELKQKINSSPATGEALSLLWILILVLLAVYIAGLLLHEFGLGWIIHILMVIILVLLILWLLRIM